MKVLKYTELNPNWMKKIMNAIIRMSSSIILLILSGK